MSSLEQAQARGRLQQDSLAQGDKKFAFPFALQVLSQLPSLTDLDISANPVATVSDVKAQLLWHIPPLSVLDGERVTELDRQVF